MLISLLVQNGRHNKKSYFSHLTDFLAMAPYPVFFRALETIIMPNFMLLTESEQLKHISALLQGLSIKVEHDYSPRKHECLNNFFWPKIKHLEEKSNKLIFHADKARRWQKLTCSFTFKSTAL